MDEGSDNRFWSKVRSLFTKSDAPLEEHIQEARQDGEIKAEDVSMLLNVLNLAETTAEDIMTPRADIFCAEESASVEEVVQLIYDSGHSRIPVYRENKDQMVGVLHAKDLLPPLLSSGGNGPPKVGELMREPYFVPETADIKTLLKTFQRKKVHLAIAVDEYGGTSGLVTLEDILEEIVGEIEDEYDAERPDDIVEQEDGSLLVSGKLDLEELAERHGILLDSEEVDTLGGYLCQLAGRIPDQGEFFTLGGRRFEVREADAKHILSILIAPPEAPPEQN